MEHWWQTFWDGLKHSRLILTHPWPIWAVAPILMGCLILIFYLYGKERRKVSPWVGRVLMFIRAILVALVLMMLLEPVLSTEFNRPIRGVVVVAVDKSMSMSVVGEVNSSGNKLMIAEALGYIGSNVRIRDAEKLGQSCGAFIKLLNESAGPKLQTYQRHLLATGGRPDPQTGKLMEEALGATNKLLRQLESIVAEGKKVAGDYAQHAAALTATLSDCVKILETFLKEDGMLVRPRLDPAAGGAVGAGSAPHASVELVRRSFDRVRPAVNEIFSLATQLQKVADELVANSGNPAIKEAFAKVNKMTRAQQVVALLASSHTKLLNKILDDNDVRLMTFDSDTKSIALPSEVNDKNLQEALGAPDGAATALGEAMLRALNSVSGDQLVGVVLFTDGQHNSKVGANPLDVAVTAAQRKIPIFTVGLGDVDPPRDVAITNLKTSETVFKTDRAIVEAFISMSGFTDQEVPVRVEKEGRLLTETKVKVTGSQKTAIAKLNFVPDWKGEETVQLVIPPQEGEFLTENNRRDFRITVIDEKLKVLLVDRDPRWEYIFLKRDLERDKYVDLNHILLSTYRDGVMPRGDKPGEFPATQDQIYRYKMIVLGDLLPESLTDMDQRNLISYVSENGGVLVILSGKMAMPARYRDLPLAELLPVVPMRYPAGWKPPGSFLEEFRIQLTPDGKNEPFLALSSDPIQNAEAWSKLPALYWFSSVERVKPSAAPLVVVLPPDWLRAGQQGEKKPSDSRLLLSSFDSFSEGVPLVVTMPVGLGKVLWIGTDSTWRWRYKVADEYFHRFWGQILRWSTTGHLTGRDKYIMMGTRKAEYEENEAILMEARILYPNPNSVAGELIPLNNSPNVIAIVYSGLNAKDPKAKEVTRVRMLYAPGSGGFYRAEFPGFKGGDYFIRLVVNELPMNNPSEASCNFRVMKNPSGEFVNVTLNEPLLREIAVRNSWKDGDTQRGGKYFNLSTVRDLPEEIKRNVKTERIKTEIEAWNHWVFFALFVFFLSLEWLIRKWKGLV